MTAPQRTPAWLTIRNRAPYSAHVPGPLPDVLIRLIARAKDELAQPYRGITENGVPREGLFPAQPIGASLQNVVDAANGFLSSLDAAQKRAVMFDIDNDAWRTWSNVHPFVLRHGLGLAKLSKVQRARALDLVASCHSDDGFKLIRDIMRLNEYLKEITGRADDYDEWFYWLSIFGTPSSTEPWGWQIDGHHLIANCFIYRNQMVLTPTFLGSEPVEALSGVYAGTCVFRAEEQCGLDVMQILTPTQKGETRLGMALPNEVLSGAYCDNIVMPFEGIRYGELTGRQQDLLRALIEVYLGRLRRPHASAVREAIVSHLDETFFAWIGGDADDSTFYYRVHSPVVLIEFGHQRGLILGPDEHSKHHVHTIMRTPNGNDYGKALLRAARAS